MSDDPFEFKTPPPKRVTTHTFKRADAMSDDTEKLLRDVPNVSEVLNRSFQEFARLELVERVARAICEAERMNPDDALGGWIHWKDAARAAIKAVLDGINAALAPPTD